MPLPLAAIDDVLKKHQLSLKIRSTNYPGSGGVETVGYTVLTCEMLTDGVTERPEHDDTDNSVDFNTATPTVAKKKSVTRTLEMDSVWSEKQNSEEPKSNDRDFKADALSEKPKGKRHCESDGITLNAPNIDDDANTEKAKTKAIKRTLGKDDVCSEKHNLEEPNLNDGAFSEKTHMGNPCMVTAVEVSATEPLSQSASELGITAKRVDPKSSSLKTSFGFACDSSDTSIAILKKVNIEKVEATNEAANLNDSADHCQNSPGLDSHDCMLSEEDQGDAHTCSAN